MSCPYGKIELEDLGLNLNDICESHVVDTIHALADTFNLPIKVLTSNAVIEAAKSTYFGVHEDHRKDLLKATMIEIDERNIVDAQENAELISDIMQDIAARERYELANS